MDLLLGLIVGTVVLLSIGYPIWKPAPRVMGSSGGPASELAALEERKESTYAAIRELGFDFHTDKLSEADYQLEIERLKAEREIAAIREQIERSRPRVAAAQAPAPMAAQTPRAPGAATLFCTQCGRAAGTEDRFCAGCGTQLRTSS